MLGLSWTEMLVIGVVALIFIGPKDLPVVMGKVGKIVGQIQRMGREFQREINKTSGLDEVRNLRNSITSPLKQTADEIRREFNTMTADGPKPSGVIKPADPEAQSVVNEIREKAGMPAAKTNDQLAAEYGFKPESAGKDSPVADAEPVKAEEPVKAAAPVKAARPTTSDKAEKTEKAVAEKVADAEVVAPAKKPPAKAAPKAEDGETPAAKPRAARKKTEAPSEKSE